MCLLLGSAATSSASPVLLDALASTSFGLAEVASQLAFFVLIVILHHANVVFASRPSDSVALGPSFGAAARLVQAA